MFIDIHNHSLYGVDDGAGGFEESIELLKEAYRQQIGAVILTPHYRHGMFGYPLEKIEEHYRQLLAAAEEIGIRIYIGCEYHVDSGIEEAFRCGRCHTLADSDYILTEYSGQSEYSDIAKYTKRLLLNGYVPVIAHVERYACLREAPELCVELSDMGAMIQVNADSVLGLEGKAVQKFAKKMLKNRWVDIIASDTHDGKVRANHMAQCYGYIAKKYGESYANRLFIHNPGKIIQAKNE